MERRQGEREWAGLGSLPDDCDLSTEKPADRTPRQQWQPWWYTNLIPPGAHCRMIALDQFREPLSMFYDAVLNEMAQMQDGDHDPSARDQLVSLLRQLDGFVADLGYPYSTSRGGAHED